MDPTPATGATQRCSIFLSYASADREAARKLKTALTAAGLEVWLDEEELAGGQAWDAKIRQQIRTCTYFMPVISATTETRREGYFRREWKLAVERTHDMADDVTFLVPVVIDDTPELAARVPEKFTTVQWTRCPAGNSTPALTDLAHRLTTDYAVPLPPALPTRPPFARSVPKVDRVVPDAVNSSPPPFPPFPHFPESGRWGRFIYDLVVWAGRLIYSMWRHLPRWLRVIATIVIVFKILSWFIGGSDSPKSKKDSDPKLPADVGDKIGELFDKAGGPGGVIADALQAGRPLAVIAFTTTDPSLKGPSTQLLAALHRDLIAGGHAGQVAVSATPFPDTSDDTALFTRAAILQCKWMLIGTVKPDSPEKFTIEVSLYETATRSRIWTTKQSSDPSSLEPTAASLSRSILEKITLDPAPTK